MSEKSQAVVAQVKQYVETIEQKLEELKNLQGAIIKRNQGAIQKIFGKEANDLKSKFEFHSNYSNVRVLFFRRYLKTIKLRECCKSQQFLK